MSRRFAERVVSAGYHAGTYWLSDLRKKGLTDENRNQGQNDKGGHLTEAMRRHYVLDEIPVRSTSTLGHIRNDPE